MCLVEVPAQYNTVTKRVLVDAEKVREINIPATYKTVTKKVLKTPASFREVDVPAEYKTVTKRLVKTPEQVKEIVIPAEYKTVTKRIVKTPAATRENAIAAEYREVTRRELVKKGSAGQWVEVICEKDLTTARIAQIQRALQSRGYNIGSAGVDNIMGNDTRNALVKFQKDNGLPVGNLNVQTLEALGVAN